MHIHITTVFDLETAWNSSHNFKATFLVSMDSSLVFGHNRVKLNPSKTVHFSRFTRLCYQVIDQTLTPEGFIHCVSPVGYVTCPTFVICFNQVVASNLIIHQQDVNLVISSQFLLKCGT